MGETSLASRDVSLQTDGTQFVSAWSFHCFPTIPMAALSHAVVDLQHNKGLSLSHHVYVVSEVKEPLLR